MDKNLTDKIPEPVPFAVHEAALAHAGENIRRLFWALVLTLILLFASNMAWLYAWMQYDYVSDTYTQDGAGINMISGRDLTYGPAVQEAGQNPQGR